MSAFSLFKRPSRLVFLDDDALFVDVLSLALPPEWRADLFLNTSACLKHIEASGAAWVEDAYKQQIMLMQGQDGMNLIPLILDYWRHTPQRYDLVQLAIFDYAMPGLNGLDAFEQLGAWPGRRVLLTGQADEHLAVKAFNQGTIQQFISKQNNQLRDCLRSQLPPLLDQPLMSHQVLWSHGLSADQQRLLADATVVQALRNWVNTQSDWVEYVVTSLPFGILGVDAAGQVSWLQLERESELDDLVELASEEGLSSADLAQILKGQVLVNVDLRLALGGELALATAPAFLLGGDADRGTAADKGKAVLGALYPLGKDYALPPEHAYAAWRTSHPNRIIRP